MPAMTLLGWFHTALGLFALTSAFYTLLKFKIISFEQYSGRVYLLLTTVVALSALGIYNQGGFGVAHILALLTLLAITGGAVTEKFKIFSSFSKYIQAFAYTSTVLFHMIPAITDFLRRLPVEDPFADSFDDPLILSFYLLFIIIYSIGLILQIRWLSKEI